MPEQENKLKYINANNFQEYISEAVSKCIQETYKVHILKIEYTKNRGAKIQLEVFPYDPGLSLNIKHGDIESQR